MAIMMPKISAELATSMSTPNNEIGTPAINPSKNTPIVRPTLICDPLQRGEFCSLLGSASFSSVMSRPVPCSHSS